MSDRSQNKCEDCRWCCGKECRFFDYAPEDPVGRNLAETCPFYEDRSNARRLDELIIQLHLIAGNLSDIREVLERL